MSSRTSLTVVCGASCQPLVAALAAALDGHVAHARGLDGLEYARGVLRCFFGAAGRGKPLVLWAPDGGPQLAAHQRRSLERAGQGLRPLVLFEGGARVPDWAWSLGTPWPVCPFLDLAAPAGALEAALGCLTPPKPSSKNSAPGFLDEQLRALRPPNPGAGTGSWRPAGALLVGDRPNHRSWSGMFDPLLSWPFISQLGSGCSAWLSEQLEAAGVWERSLYWVNAFRAGGEATCDLKALEQRLRPAVVVALGRNAAELLRGCGVKKFEQVHHPAHWKRWHAHEKYHLVKLLRRAQLT